MAVKQSEPWIVGDKIHFRSFELIKLAGKPTAGVMKDVVMVGGYQEEVWDRR